MMPSVAMSTTIGIYILIGVLLLSLNLASRWRWWVKAGAILATAAAFVGTYFLVDGLLGWPTSAPLPERFVLLWVEIKEPEAADNSPGAIYLWVANVDDNNVPYGPPRGFQLPYTEQTASDVNEAQDQRLAGWAIMGTVENESEQTVQTPNAEGGQEGNVPNQDIRLEFDRLPPPITPDKGPDPAAPRAVPGPA